MSKTGEWFEQISVGAIWEIFQLKQFGFELQGKAPRVIT